MKNYNKQETVSKEYEEHVKKYLKEECEGESFELIALTGFNVEGADKLINSDFYSQHFTCIATIENNEVVEDEIEIMHFLDNTSPLKFLDVKDLTPYIFEVKKVKKYDSFNRDLYCLVELKGKSDTNLFDSIIKEKTKPLFIKEGDDVLEYNGMLNEYEGKIIINGKQIETSLKAGRSEADMRESLDTLRKIKDDFDGFYNRVLLQCATRLTNLANDWREDDDEHEITEEEFTSRIDADWFNILINKKQYTIYFDDDDIFGGYSIVYDGNIETNKFDAIISE